MKFWNGQQGERKAGAMKWVIALAVVVPFGSVVLVALALAHWVKMVATAGPRVV